MQHIPLRKGLVASDVSSLARFAAVTGLGVALARWTATWTDHFGLVAWGRTGTGVKDSTGGVVANELMGTSAL